MKAVDNLIGAKVKINIKDKSGYTSDLYKSIQGATGTITQKQSKDSLYNDAWLVKFTGSGLM